MIFENKIWQQLLEKQLLSTNNFAAEFVFSEKWMVKRVLFFIGKKEKCN